jgi:hypothetical protein
MSKTNKTKQNKTKQNVAMKLRFPPRCQLCLHPLTQNLSLTIFMSVATTLGAFGLTNYVEQSPSSEANSRPESQELLDFYTILRFITVYTTARHWTLTWDRSVQSTTYNPISVRSILILSSHLRLGLPEVSSIHIFRPIFLNFFVSRMLATCPTHHIPLDLFTLITFGEAGQLL